MIKFLRLLCSVTIIGSATPVVQAMELNTVQNNINSFNKVNISDYKINDEDIHIKNNTKNIKDTVFLELSTIYENYSDFFTDLIINEENYIITGADFTIPVDPMGEKYKIVILALPFNENYCGKIKFNITLFPSFERIDLSKYDKLFDKNDEDKNASITINKDVASSTILLSEDNALKAVDSFFVTNPDSVEWHFNRNKNLLLDNKKDLSVKIEPTYKHNGYTEGFFKVTISPMEQSKIFLPYTLIAYVHETVNFKQIDKDVNFTFNHIIGANWSTNNKWKWENDNQWFTLLDVKDYLTAEEKINAENDYISAFFKKFSFINFFVSGYVMDYNNNKDYLCPAYSLTLSKYNQNYVQYKIVDLDDNGFGVSFTNYVTLSYRIVENTKIQYNIDASMSVMGFGAKWQYTAMNFSINKISFSNTYYKTDPIKFESLS